MCIRDRKCAIRHEDCSYPKPVVIHYLEETHTDQFLVPCKLKHSFLFFTTLLILSNSVHADLQLRQCTCIVCCYSVIYFIHGHNLRISFPDPRLNKHYVSFRNVHTNFYSLLIQPIVLQQCRATTINQFLLFLILKIPL